MAKTRKRKLLPEGEEFGYEYEEKSPEIPVEIGGYELRKDDATCMSVMVDGVRVGSAVRMDSGNWIGSWFRQGGRSGRALDADPHNAVDRARHEAKFLV